MLTKTEEHGVLRAQCLFFCKSYGQKSSGIPPKPHIYSTYQGERRWPLHWDWRGSSSEAHESACQDLGKIYSRRHTGRCWLRTGLGSLLPSASQQRDLAPHATDHFEHTLGSWPSKRSYSSQASRRTASVQIQDRRTLRIRRPRWSRWAHP